MVRSAESYDRPSQPPDLGSTPAPIIDIRPRRISEHTGITDPLPQEAQESVRGMREMVLQANKIFPLDQTRVTPSIVGRNGRFDQPVPYLQVHGVHKAELDVLFDTSGRWRFKTEKEFNPFDLTPEEVNVRMSNLLSPVNQIIDRSLDALSEDGFNRHGAEHADAVTSQGLRLLEIDRADDKTKRNLVIAAQAHDIGNLFGREPHPLISVQMLRRIIPDIATYSPEDWQTIRRAIMLHDSDNLAVVTSMRDHLSPDRRLEWLADYLKPEGLALLIADKVEVGRSRLSDKLRRGRIERDEHAIINLLGTHKGIEIVGDSFVWTVEYSSDFSDEDREGLGQLADIWEDKVQAGEVAVDFYTWYQLFIKHYTPRIITTAESSLALFPSVDHFELVTRDKKLTRREIHTNFSRETLAADTGRIKEERNKYRRVKPSQK